MNSSGNRGNTPGRIKPLALLLIPLAVAIAYGDAFHAPFAFDDRIHILENPLVTSFKTVSDWDAIIQMFKSSGLSGRPLLVLTYGMNYAASGANPEAFRFVNLFIHATNCFLVFAIAMELAACFRIDIKNRFWPALLAALLFAAHPLLTEAVTYIAGRSASLCGTFYFAGLYAALRAGREQRRQTWILLALTGIFTVLALLVKQDAFTLPAACIVLVWFAWPPAMSIKTRWAATVFLATITALAVGLQVGELAALSQTTQRNSALVAAGFEPTLGFVPYVLTSIASYSSYYLWRLPVPVRLSVDPQVNVITTWMSPAFVASLAVVLSLTVLAIWLRNRRPLLSIGIGLVIISPLSAYCVFPLADVVAEHRAYISAFGVVIVFADALMMLRFRAVIAFALIAVFAGMSIARNAVWSDEVLLWEDARQKAPEKIRPHVNLGALYQSKGQFDQAIREYQFVLAREPRHSSALANLASIHLERNNLAAAEDLLSRAIAQGTEFSAAYLNIGVVRLRQGRFDESRALLERAIALNPNQLMAHLDLGDVLFNQGQPSKAIDHYLAEIRINPSFQMTHAHLARAYELTGMREKAIEQYRIAAALNPADSEVQAALNRLK
jgi:Tfp pilus assembly protein PilF